MIPSRHPWLARFESAPEAAFGELLSGYAEIHPYERADAPDAARMLFGPLEREDGARKVLGSAILSWLENKRKEQLPAVRPKLQRRAREICEAFEIVALLGVADAAVELRQRFLIWNDWVARLVLSPARDARAEYWRMLALTQPLVTEAEPTIDTIDLAPMWQRVCREAGGRLPRHYLSIGLLGLRRLPEIEEASEFAWVSGLAQWALARRPSETEFKAEWFALKPLYPRAPQRWRRVIARLLSAPIFKSAEIEAPAWWRVDPDFSPMLRENFTFSGAPLRSPMPQDCDRVIERLDNQFVHVEPMIDDLLARHRRYLYATGDAQYFVRAIHTLGRELIELGGDQPRVRTEKVQTMAREGLKWQPYNRYLWALWRDALEAEGNLEAAELVGWEFVRRDAANVNARTQLALLLADALDRIDDAEMLLKETTAKFPDNLFATAQLAGVLARSPGRRIEAEAMLKDALAQDSKSIVVRTQLGTLLAHWPARHAAAEVFLKETIERFPDDDIAARTQLAILFAKSKDRIVDAKTLLRATISKFPKNFHAREILIELLRKIPEDRGALVELVRDTVKHFPADVSMRETLSELLAQSKQSEVVGSEDRLPTESNLSQVDRPEELGGTRPSSDKTTSERAYIEATEHVETKPATRAAAQSNSDAGPRSRLEQTKVDQTDSLSVDAPSVEPSVDTDAHEVSDPQATMPFSDPFLEEISRRGAVRRLRFRISNATLDRRREAIAELDRIFQEDPTFAYAELLAARHGIWQGQSSALPSFAAAFEQALANEDRQTLDQLSQRQPRLEALILVARAVLGDVEATGAAEAWLRAPELDGEEPASRVLRSGLRPILNLIDGGQSALQAFSQMRHTVTSALHDANEAELGDLFVAA